MNRILGSVGFLGVIVLLQLQLHAFEPFLPLPVGLDPGLIIGPELKMDEPLITAAIGAQHFLSSGVSGNVVLVVWNETVWPVNPQGVIKAARLDLEGHLLDATGFVITTNASFMPVVAANSSGFLVCWLEGPRPENWDIYGVRVSLEGEIKDRPAFPICTAPLNQDSLSAAAVSNQYLVTWSDYRTETLEVYAARVSNAGEVLDPDGFRVSTTGHVANEPQAIGLTNEYVLVWAETDLNMRTEMLGTCVGVDGSMTPTGGFMISDGIGGRNGSPSLARIGETFLATWRDTREISMGNVIHSGRRFKADGELLGEIFEIRKSNPMQFKVYLWAGPENFLAYWITVEGNRELRSTVISAEGLVDNPEGNLVFTNFYSEAPVGAWTETNGYWIGFSSLAEDSDVLAVRLTREAKRSDAEPMIITRSANRERAPAVAWNGEVYLVVWQDNRGFGNGSDIYGIRIAPDGAFLDTNAFPICTAMDRQYSPAAAACGSDFLVVWSDERNMRDGSTNWVDIYGTIVDGSGRVQQTGGFPVSVALRTQRAPGVAASSNQFFVVWRDDRNGFGSDIFGARVSRTGTVLDTNGIPVSVRSRVQAAPAVASDGKDFFAVWRDDSLGENNPDIQGALVTAEGTVLVEEKAICTIQGHQRGPEIDFDGNYYLAVWRDLRAGSSEIYGTRITRDGAVVETNGFAIQAGSFALEPAVAASGGGEGFLVLWQNTNSVDQGSLYAKQVTTTGVVSSNLIAAGTELYDADILLAAGGRVGQFLVVTEGMRAESERVFARFIDFAARPSLGIGAGEKVTISWPSWASDFRLMERSSLVGGTWSNVMTSPEVNGDLVRVILPVEGGTRFYRLKK